jgi:hypothetical protein
VGGRCASICNDSGWIPNPDIKVLLLRTLCDKDCHPARPMWFFAINFKRQNGVASVYCVHFLYIQQHKLIVISADEGLRCDASQIAHEFSNAWLGTAQSTPTRLMIDRWGKWYANNNNDDNDPRLSFNMQNNFRD